MNQDGVTEGDLPGGSDGKESKMGYLDLIPGPGKSPEEGNQSIFAWRIA